MPNIMHTNLFHSCLLRPSLHFMVEIGFCDRKQPLVRLNVIQHFDIFLHFLTEKWRHFDCTVTLFRFRACDNIPPFRSVKCLADCDRLFLKIKISRSERQQLAGADSAPVKHFKGIIGTGLSIMASENLRYSSFVQKSISFGTSFPIVPARLAGL